MANWNWRNNLTAWFLGLVVLGLTFWAYLPALLVFGYRWTIEPDYIHGFLVIPFAAALLWMRRDMLRDGPGRPSWWGLLLAIGGAGTWLLGGSRGSPALVGLSLVPLLWGVALFVGGTRTLRWSWPATAFLAFMIPLPPAMAEWLRGPLREIGANCGVFIIQMLGLAADAEGTIIHLRGGELGVADVCSGVRMMMLFFAVCVGAALVLEVKPWEKVVIVVSAIPIAVVSNVLRITITALLHELAGAELADRVFHDLAGWLMMPLAIVLLMGELTLIRQVIQTDRQPGSGDACTPAEASGG